VCSTLPSCFISSLATDCGYTCTPTTAKSTSAKDAVTAVDHLSICVTDISDWMTASRLRLNPTKTQVMWLGSSQQLDKIAIRELPLLSTHVTVVDTARDLGVVLDRQLSLDTRVTAVCRSDYYQLRQLRPITRSLSVEAAKSLVQAFISNRLDYCNAILYGLPDRLMRRWQSVQNAAAWLITSASRRDHITPLATSTRTCQLQHRRPGFPVFDQSGTGLPGGGLSARRRCQRSPTSICRHSNLCHAPHVQHLRRPMLHSCGSTAMELATDQSKTMSQSGTIQAFVKNIYV